MAKYLQNQWQCICVFTKMVNMVNIIPTLYPNISMITLLSWAWCHTCFSLSAVLHSCYHSCRLCYYTVTTASTSKLNTEPTNNKKYITVQHVLLNALCVGLGSLIFAIKNKPFDSLCLCRPRRASVPPATLLLPSRQLTMCPWMDHPLMCCHAS